MCYYNEFSYNDNNDDNNTRNNINDNNNDIMMKNILTLSTLLTTLGSLLISSCNPFVLPSLAYV